MIARHLAQGHIHPEKLHAYQISISLPQITPPTQKLHITYCACSTLTVRNDMIKL